jgi:arylformamidase
MKSGPWTDVSRPLEPGKLPVWPGDPTPSIWLADRIDPARGGHSNVSAASFCLHWGTHVDAPRHFFAEGRAIENISLERCIGPARVIHHFPERNLSAADLDRAGLDGVERLLIRTACSAWPSDGVFRPDYPSLLPDAARFLVERKIRLVGIDYLSIGPPGPPGDEVHRILLGAEVVILEGLLLREIEPGDYEMVALPLLVSGSDGAPVRAVIRPVR